MAQKKEVKVRDLKPSKDAKGGVARNAAAGSTSRNASTNRSTNRSTTSSKTTL